MIEIGPQAPGLLAFYKQQGSTEVLPVEHGRWGTVPLVSQNASFSLLFKSSILNLFTCHTLFWQSGDICGLLYQPFLKMLIVINTHKIKVTTLTIYKGPVQWDFVCSQGCAALHRTLFILQN